MVSVILDRLAKNGKDKKGFDFFPFRSCLKQFTGSVDQCFAMDKSLVLIFIDIKDFHKVDRLNGAEAAARLLGQMMELLKKKVSGMIPAGEVILVVDRLLGDEFVVIYSCKGRPSREDLCNVSISWRLGLKEMMNRVICNQFGVVVDIHVGSAAIEPADPGSVEIKLYSAFREAQKNARGQKDPKNAKMLDEFQRLMEEKNFEIEYQPIISLSSGVILGWEALTRGPRDGNFRSPQVIFSFAAEVNLLYPLERICRHLAVERLGSIGTDQKIFLNINPLTICDPNFVKGETLNLIRQNGLNQKNIVFEITEQADMRNMPHFKRTLEHYRDQGYMVAIDDTGAGFSSLQAIAQVRPDYIKIDMSLVRGVDEDPVKRALMETFVAFSEKINCCIIAEGIETENELKALVGMGVHYGQGYHLARPAFPKSAPSNELCLNIARLSFRKKQLVWRHSMPVEDIMEGCPVVNSGIKVGQVKKMFDANYNLSGLVVVEGGRPVGLVMKQHLYGRLSAQYGVALYSSRPVKVIMDNFPLVIEWYTPVETASQVAMSRDGARLYDHVIVTRNGQYTGVVTVQNLISSLTRIQLEFAKGSNPLTGLPGNNVIEEEIKGRLSEDRPFVLVYLDLDNFKVFNDRYGFEQGDRLLLFTSRLLTRVIGKYGNADDFVGHLGGDDFVLITSPDRVEEICRRMIRYFDRLVLCCYSEEDRRNKGFAGENREGVKKWYPIVSVSMALVECPAGCRNDIDRISKTAADLKQYAKSIPGSLYVRDRRQLNMPDKKALGVVN